MCLKTTSTFGVPGRGARLAVLGFSGFITMVDIHSMVASSHPSRHEREVERGATSRPRVGRLRRAGGHSGATTVIVKSQPQRTAGAVPAPSVVAGADVTLLAARQLLNNPPPFGASPSAAEEWRHNVDQLVVAAINTPLHERRCQPSVQFSHTPAAHAPSAARAPPVEHALPVGPDGHQTTRHRALMASYAMADLRADIDHRRGGEDGRVTIKHRRERRRDIEGHDLEKDFDSHAPSRRSPSAREAYPPSSPGVTGGGGCMALAPHLRMVVWTRKFQPHLPEKYDGIVNPAEFLQIYSTSILAAGGE
jgi:hypothetical protein